MPRLPKTGPSTPSLRPTPRLQVEHTVTEEVTGLDLVKLQLQLAAGQSLAGLAFEQADIPQPRGFALQARINMETMQADGDARPAGGLLNTFELPSGPGLRVDSFGYAGYRTSPRFDSLLAKLVASSPSREFRDVVTRAYRALCECKNRRRGDQYPVFAEPAAPSPFRRKPGLYPLC